MNATISEQNDNHPLRCNGRFRVAASSWAIRVGSKKQNTTNDQHSDNENCSQGLQCQTYSLPARAPRVRDWEQLPWYMYFLVVIFLQRRNILFLQLILQLILLLIEMVHLINHVFQFGVLEDMIYEMHHLYQQEDQ